jgi:hypothetical protein
MPSSTGQATTTNASRYLQQLCKHWSHSLAVEFTPQTGRIVFPKDNRGASWPADAVATLTAHPDRLECRLDASVDEQLIGMQGVLQRHLDRFAFREAPLAIAWGPTSP